MQKHILRVEDLSCLGRCALTASLPVLSCLGIRVTPLPTLLLSSHTGGFPDVKKRSLSKEMQAFSAAWEGLELHFDAIHVGYVADAGQLLIVEQLIRRYRGEGCLLFVDPVMGDWGKRYSGLGEELEEGFRRLCAKADLIFPNRTEAALLLGEEYKKDADSPRGLLRQLQGLLGLGARAAVITGISGGDGHIGAASLSASDAAPAVSLTRRIQGHWPGTGDLFSAAVEGALLRGFPLEEGVRAAAQFVHDSVRDASNDPKISRFGAPFEAALPGLMRALNIA